MIPESKLKEIKDHLNSSENPLFFFDNDTDGLCSYLLLKRYIKRGKGIVTKSSPYSSAPYLRKIEEYSPDKVFILDKPIVNQEVIDKTKVPIIWIDHHIPQKPKGAHYFNPRLKKHSDNTPTSYWCYKITKKDMWISSIGVIGDWHIPKFFNELSKNYPDLIKKTKDPGKIIYETQLGNLIRMYNFLLKGKTSDVRKSISIIEKINSPYELLNKETPKSIKQY